MWLSSEPREYLMALAYTYADKPVSQTPLPPSKIPNLVN